MKFNVDPGQSAFYDTFSLRDATAPATERLTNGAVDLGPPPPPPGWSLTEVNGDTAALAGFADHPGDPGELGLWLRPFVTGTPNGDATLSQTVPASPGLLRFTGWSRWEANYSGGVPATPTNTLMRMEYLDSGNAVIGSDTLNLRVDRTAQAGGGNPNDNIWRRHVLDGDAPLGTTAVRVSAIGDNMFNTSGAQSAFFDDFTLVPEPASVLLVCLGMLGTLGLARRR
jgi:hypothetical protein